MLQKLKIKTALWILDGMMKPGKNLRKTIVFLKVKEYLKGEKQMETIAKLRGILIGKKTYVLALGAIIGTIVAWTQGQVTDIEAVQQIWAALVATTIRAGVKGVETPDSKAVEEKK